MRREGFTLIELLVVIGIIALLLALIMPAVQAVRRQARAVVCQARIRQLAMDMHSYEADNHTLPHGMAPGLFALLLGVHPQEVHQWYLAIYVDAVEWVELPNTLGMSQYGDGGIMASKPYAATGKYIQRMSNYCAGCRYAPEKALGEDACPFTALYWDFLIRHEKQLKGNPRMQLQVRNLERRGTDDRRAIRKKAATLKKAILS